jgi:dihydrofolate reductase
VVVHPQDGRPLSNSTVGFARIDRTTKGVATMKLTTTAQISVDGVMQGPGGPDEDERAVFERGGWAHFDNEAGTAMDVIYQRADTFLFGRRTYEIFAGSWGTWDDPGDSPIWTALHTRPKYVASSAPFDPKWANTTVFSGDTGAAIRELKAQPGGELQVHGSGALFRWLLENELVDEINLFIFPVVVGQGTRLFPDTGKDFALELVGSQATTPGGVTIQVYHPAGRPRYATAAGD